MYTMKRSLLAMATLVLAVSSHAHDTFFEPATPAAEGQYIVRFADDGKPLSYPASKLKRVWAQGANGQAVPLQSMPKDGFVVVSAPAETSVMALEFENGFFSRTLQGTVEKPLNEVPNSVSAVWAKKAGKYVNRWSAQVTKPSGLELEIVPVNAAQPKAGETITVQLLWQGKPAEGLKISRGENESGPVTDANGMARYTVQSGRNFIWAERRAAVAGDPRYTTLAVATNLIFIVN